MSNSSDVMYARYINLTLSHHIFTKISATDNDWNLQHTRFGIRLMRLKDKTDFATISAILISMLTFVYYIYYVHVCALLVDIAYIYI